MIVTLIFLFVCLHYSQGILGGGDCSKIPHSFMVAIFLHQNNKTQFLGGGTLLSADWILTVGIHFYTNPKDIYYEAVAGADNLSEANSKQPHLQKSRFTEFHRTTEHIEMGLDIALLKLKNPMFKSKRVSIVRWSTNLDIGNETLDQICGNATIMGYGTLKTFNGNVAKKYGDLHCAEIPVPSEPDCKGKFRNSFIPFQAACIYGATDACYGDAGGPVMCNGIQYGVLTYHYDCGEGVPSLFTRVYPYENFIRKLIGQTIVRINFKTSSLASAKIKTNNYFLNFFVLLVYYYYY